MKISHSKITTILVILLLVFNIVLLATARSSNAATASCYADTTDGFLWGTTANGTIVTPRTVGAASNTLELNTKWYMRYKNKTINIKIIDRGGYNTVDLTWGTVKLYGYSTCASWGIKNVQIFRRIN